MDNANEKMIMVVDRVILFADEYFQGFAPVGQLDYETIILDNYHYENREFAEQNPSLKQPIAYCMIVNTKTKKIFAYKRSSKPDEYNERRLRGKWSWGIGGHIDKIDLNEENPIRASLQREIDEEIEIGEMSDPQILGYINDDQTSVGAVHFGLLYVIYVNDDKVKPKSNEIASGSFLSVAKLNEIAASEKEPVEHWSVIALGPLRDLVDNFEKRSGAT